MCIILHNILINRKFNKEIKNNYSEKEQAIASMTKVLLEDRVFW